MKNKDNKKKKEDSIISLFQKLGLKYVETHKTGATVIFSQRPPK